ncbi:MAG: sugar ABC transporter permease [Clostridia bacterium]|nr:sugar ABC transporter permease [Clostridia bacterium]
MEAEKKKETLTQAIKKDSSYYLMILPALIFTLIFCYIPMLGIAMSFKDYDFVKGFWNSEWVGMKHFIEIFHIPMLQKAVLNTVYLNLLSLVICFTLPIVFALLINEVKNGIYKKTLQTVSYLPHFLSWISVVAMAYSIYAIDGPINHLRAVLFGIPWEERTMYMSLQSFFVPNYIFLSAWKEMGWDSIIYIAAISGIDQQLYEAARIDGASKLKQAWYITLPGIAPTIVILLILKFGSMFASNFELVYGMQNAYVEYDVISTLVYKNGIRDGQYSLATAINLFQSLISLALIFIANKISDKVNNVSLW